MIVEFVRTSSASRFASLALSNEKFSPSSSAVVAYTAEYPSEKRSDLDSVIGRVRDWSSGLVVEVVVVVVVAVVA